MILFRITFCFFLFCGINANEIISDDRNMISKVDILGRNNIIKQCLYIEIYDDGSVEKKYIIK